MLRPDEERDHGWIVDMVLAAESIVRFTGGLSREAFEGDEVRVLAAERQLTIIGEAAKRISPEFRSLHPDVPWRRIAGMRDRLMHDYRGMERDVVWLAVSRSIPDLIAMLKPLIPADDESDERWVRPPVHRGDLNRTCSRLTANVVRTGRCGRADSARSSRTRTRT